MTDASLLRDLTPDDLDWAHALNQKNAVALADTNRRDFEALVANACFARVAGPNAAFLLAFDRRPTDDSVNYQWFERRYRRFVYIDRVAVAEHGRRRGLAAALYSDLFEFARASGAVIVGAEVNSDPPNPASDAFHQGQGFRIVGEARLEGRGKTVRYFSRML